MKAKKDFYKEEKEIQKAIAENIKKLRTEHHMSQETFAHKLHLLRQTISAYERGVTLPNILVLIQIADLFGITLDELTGRDISSTHISQKTSQRKSPEIPRDAFRNCNRLSKSQINLNFGLSLSKKEKP